MKKFLSLLLVLVMVLAMAHDVFAAEVSFTDVEAGKYYEYPVQWAVENEITNGKTETTFAPSLGCTRKEVVTLLWRAAGKPEATIENPFTDVPAGKYYTEAVLWALENKITLGKTATTFEPDETCTRAQIVTFLYRYNGEPAVEGKVEFPDVAEGKYYTNAVVWAAANGITNGNKEGNFQPDKTCTRGDIVTFLYRNVVSAPVVVSGSGELTTVVVYPENSTTYLINGRLSGQILTINAADGITVTVDGKEVKAVNKQFVAELTGAPTTEVVVSNENKTKVELVASIDWAKGTEGNPIAVSAAGDYGVSAAAGESVYYAVNAQLDGYTLTANVKGATVTVNGKAVEGETVLAASAATIEVVVTAGKEAVEGTISVTAAPGSATNPTVISAAGDYGVTLAAGEAGYYAVNASLDGYTLTTNVKGATVTVNGKEVKDSVVLEAKGATIEVVVTAGEKADGTLIITAPVGSETNPIVINSASEMTGVEAKAGTSTYYAVSSDLNGQVLTIVAAEGLTVKVNGYTLTAADGVYTADLNKTPVNEVIITAAKDAAAVAEINWAKGSYNNPYIINSADEMLTVSAGVSVEAGSMVYYQINTGLNGNYVYASAADGVMAILNGTVVTADGAELTGTPVNMLVITNTSNVTANATANILSAPGTEGNPIRVADKAVEVTVAAGETVYHAGSVVGNILSIESDGAFEVGYNENTYSPRPPMMSPSWTLNSEFPAQPGAPIVGTETFAVKNTSEAEITYTIKLTSLTGTMNYPEEITDISDLSTTLAAEQQAYFYKWTATEDGTLKVKVSEVTVEDSYTEADVKLTNNSTMAQRDLLYDAVDNVISLDVKEGDEVIIEVSAVLWGMMGQSYPGGEFVISAEVVPAAAE